MYPNPSDLICCPKCRKELSYSLTDNPIAGKSGVWHCPKCAGEYLFSGGFIHFIGDNDVFRFSKREEFFRSIYARLYTPLTNIMFLPCGGVKNARAEVLENLELRPGSVVLETGIGTGDNLFFLNGKLDSCSYHGLDNQVRMLDACARNANKWNRPLSLYRANAEELPFKDKSFDVVFHLGAINLFQDKKAAVEEMIRVARPGSRIVIADENDKATRLFAIFVGRQPPVIPPVDLVPSSMLELTLKTIWNGYGYLITFRNPF